MHQRASERGQLPIIYSYLLVRVGRSRPTARTKEHCTSIFCLCLIAIASAQAASASISESQYENEQKMVAKYTSIDLANLDQNIARMEEPRYSLRALSIYNDGKQTCTRTLGQSLERVKCFQLQRVLLSLVILSG